MPKNCRAFQCKAPFCPSPAVAFRRAEAQGVHCGGRCVQARSALIRRTYGRQDYEGLCAMTDILNRLHMETGNTMITVTHDVRCAEALCDRAIYIKNGVVAKEGGKELVREYFSSENI